MIIKVKTFAKINLTLEILNKREDGFHNIQSIMQSISLYDVLKVRIFQNINDENIIRLSGSSNNLPYDETNLVYKAIEKYLEYASRIKGQIIEVFIEKNIPISAGLAGGSSNVAGILLALNKLYSNILSIKDIYSIAMQLGSDINFCLLGGSCLCTSRGEIVEKLKDISNGYVSLVKTINIGVSAGFAYKKFSQLNNVHLDNKTLKLKNLINSSSMIDPSLLYNDLELAIKDEFEEFCYIKRNLKGAIMSGSGSTFFVLGKQNPEYLNKIFDSSVYEIYPNLSFVNSGVEFFS